MHLLHLRNQLIPKPIKLIPLSPPKPKPSGKSPLHFIIALVILACVGLATKHFIEKDKDGNPQLAEWRQEKLQKELNDLDEAEQYVLVAKRNGTFPCYSCPNSTTIELEIWEIWRYGVTSKGEKGRYRNSLEGTNLMYLVQFEGNIAECMKEEKRKIYHYALLPENLKRAVPLIRPPGNKQDN